MARRPVKTHLGPEQRWSRNANKNENKRQFKEEKKMEGRKREEEEGGGQQSQRASARLTWGQCVAFTYTHTRTHTVSPPTFSELLHKSWQGPRVPSDLVIQGLIWPHWSFHQVRAEQIVHVSLSVLKGRSTVSLLKLFLYCVFFLLKAIKYETTSSLDFSSVQTGNHWHLQND